MLQRSHIRVTSAPRPKEVGSSKFPANHAQALEWLKITGSGAGGLNAAPLRHKISEARVLQGKYEVGSLLRGAIEDLDRRNSKGWMREYAQSLLGVELTRQKQYADAERLLLQGYDGLNRRAAAIPAYSKSVMEMAGAWIVQLYREWGKPNQAAEWQTKVRRVASSASK